MPDEKPHMSPSAKSQSQPTDRPDPKRQAARDAWGRTVRGALDDRDISVNAAARTVGVSRNTLVSWLEGRADPDPWIFPALSEVTGLSHELLLELTGMLPPALGAAAYQLHAAAELRGSLSRLRDWVEQALESAESRPAAQVAGALMSRSTQWQVVLRPAVRGRRHRILQHTYLGLIPLHKPPLAVESMRGEASKLLSGLYEQFGVTWREQEAHDFPDHPPLLLLVPDQERPRAPRHSPAQGPRTILFLGPPYGHAEFLGSLVAEALGYGYADLRYGPDGPSLNGSPAARTAAMVSHARQLLSRRPHRMVWSLADHRVMTAVADELAASELPLVIVVQAGARLRQRGCQVWQLTEPEMDKVHQRLSHFLAEAPWPVIHVAVDDERISENGEVNSDLLVDEMVANSLRVLMEIHLHHGGPAPTYWEGAPGRLAAARARVPR